jgi:uncharacterized protein YbjT (DUF2867 family)
MTKKRIGLAVLAALGALIIWSFIPNQFPVYETQASTAPEGGHHVLIFGATRNSGLETAKILIGRGDRVTAFVRESSNTAELESLGVNLVVGDALDMPSVEAAFVDKDYTSVVTTIACFSCDPKPDYLGNRNVFDAAESAGVRRVILMTTVGAGDSYEAAPLPARNFLKDIIPLKTQAEDHLMASSLDYTIIRPGGLKSGPATGRAYLSASREAFGIINRADLAGLVVNIIDDDNTIGEVLAAMDADMVFPWDMLF